MRFLLPAVFLLSLSLVCAQDAAPDPQPEQATPESKQKALDMTVMVLTQSLSLTPDQQAKIRPILQDKFKKADEIRNNTALSDEQKQAKWKELYESGRNEVGALLTPQQKATLDQLASTYNRQNTAPAAPAPAPAAN